MAFPRRQPWVMVVALGLGIAKTKQKTKAVGYMFPHYQRARCRCPFIHKVKRSIYGTNWSAHGKKRLLFLISTIKKLD